MVIPRSPLQAKGLLLASIDAPDPIIFLEPKALYRASTEQVPISSYHLPLDKAEVLVPGSDLTVVSYGVPVYACERAIAMLRDPPPSVAHLVPESLRGLEVELIDLRTVCPLDAGTVARSVQKTGRCVVVHEAAQTGGVGAEVAALVQTECFSRSRPPFSLTCPLADGGGGDRLEAPVKRVCGWDTPFPCALEKFYVSPSLRSRGDRSPSPRRDRSQTRSGSWTPSSRRRPIDLPSSHCIVAVHETASRGESKVLCVSLGTAMYTLLQSSLPNPSRRRRGALFTESSGRWGRPVVGPVA